jgi:hypothetical protein
MPQRPKTSSVRRMMSERSVVTHGVENLEADEDQQPENKMVPRGGIEPPTPAFSVLKWRFPRISHLSPRRFNLLSLRSFLKPKNTLAILEMPEQSVPQRYQITAPIAELSEAVLAESCNPRRRLPIGIAHP